MANTQGGGLLGQKFAQQIRSTIARVDGMPFGGGIARIPTELGGDTAFVPKTFRVCTFTGSWSLNASKTVTFRGVTSTPNTVSATNLFYNLPDNGQSDCAIAKDGTAWYLVQDVHTQVTVITNVTLGTAGLQFTRAVVTVVATATAGVTTIGTTACA